MKELVEISKRIKEIEVLVRDNKATDETEKELDELLERKSGIEEKQKRMQEKFKTASDINIPEAVKEDPEEKDKYATLEYRNKFRDVVTRADATTQTGDVTSIIPTTVVNRVIEELKDYGNIMPLISQTSYPGGIEIPVAGAKPTASWVSEGTVADKQKKVIDGKVTFSYYKLQMRVAITLLASTVSLESWEQMVAKNIAEAMGVAIEESVFNGSGTGQPLGITNDLDLGAGEGRIAEANQITFDVASDASYKGWLTKLIGKMPEAYRKKSGNVIFMNHATFDSYVDGLVDADGHPIARVDHGLTEEAASRMLGKQVIFTDLLPSADEAGLDEVFVVYGNLSNYMFNSNLSITYRQYFDEDTDEFVRKATLIGDGKLGDTNGIIVLKTPAS